MSAQGTRSSRVLFINIVQDGKVVQERVIAPGEDVTVGSGAKASFVVTDAGFAHEAFPLFVARDGAYRLRFTSAVKGRITSAGEKIELAKALGESSADEGDGVRSVPLTEADKGKLKVGSVTVLFKFVEQPQVAPVAAPLEKLDFRASFLFDDEDPIFAVSLAFWTALAVVFAIWIQTTEPPPIDIEKVSQRIVKIAKIEAPVEPKEKVDDTREDEKPDDDAAADAEKAEEKKKADDKPVDKVDKAERIETAKAQLQEQSALFRQLQARMLGTTGESKSALITSGGDYQGLGQDLKAVEDAGKNSGDGTGLRTGTTVAGADGDRTIGKVEQKAGGTAKLDDAPQIAIKGSVKTDDLDFGGGDVTNVEKVVRQYQGQLKYCYETSLKANPSLAGRVIVGWTVAGGAATDVYIVENTTGDAGFAECITSKIRRSWKFTGVDDGEAKSTFIFTPQD